MDFKMNARRIKASLIIFCISTLQSTICLATVTTENDQLDEQTIETPATKAASAPSASGSMDNKALAQFSSILAASGITYTQNKDHMTVNIKKDKALAAIPEVQSMGGLDTDLTPEAIKAHPTLLATQVGLFYTIAIVQYVYLIPTTGNLQVTVNLMTQDDGKETSNSIATFDFTRKLDNRMNYDKLTPESLAKDAPNFHYTDWYNEHKNN